MKMCYASWSIAVKVDRNTPLYVTLFSVTTPIESIYLTSEEAARRHPFFVKMLRGVQEFCRISNNNRIQYRLSVCEIGKQPLFLHFQTPQTPLL